MTEREEWEAQVVRAALDLQADLLDDLGRHEEAAEARARTPRDTPPA